MPVCESCLLKDTYKKVKVVSKLTVAARCNDSYSWICRIFCFRIFTTWRLLKYWSVSVYVSKCCSKTFSEMHLFWLTECLYGSNVFSRQKCSLFHFCCLDDNFYIQFYVLPSSLRRLPVNDEGLKKLNDWALNWSGSKPPLLLPPEPSWSLEGSMKLALIMLTWLGSKLGTWPPGN